MASSDPPRMTAVMAGAPPRAPGMPIQSDAVDARQVDFQLVQRLVGGDAAAWRTFVDRFSRLVLARVIATAREMNQTLASGDAEDLCAEVFSQLVANHYAALARFEGRSALSTWLCVVTRRIALRRLAARRRDLAQSAEVAARKSLPGSGHENPLTLVINEEERAQVAAALAQLGERQREMAKLFYIEGCSYREISERLDMPINSVGPTLNRLHAKLRAALSSADSRRAEARLPP